MRNILYKGFVIDPSVELVPSITISPFSLSFDTISITTQMNGGGCLKRLEETISYSQNAVLQYMQRFLIILYSLMTWFQSLRLQEILILVVV